MNIRKVTAALTAAVLVLGAAAVPAAGNVTVMADEITSQATSDTSSDTVGDSTSSGEDSTGSEETPDEAAYTLASVDATVTDASGVTLPKRGAVIGSDGSTITVTVSTSQSVPPASATVSLTGVATNGTETVELTAEPVTVNPRVTPNTADYTLRNTDGTVSLSGKVNLKVNSEAKKVTLSDVSAVVTDASGATVSSEVAEVGSDSITVTVPHNTPNGSVTVKLTAGKVDYEYEDMTVPRTLTAEPVTVDIDDDSGSTYQLKSADGYYGAGGKVFVKKAAAPSTSEPDTSTPDTSEPSTSTPSTSEPSTSTPSTSTPSTSTPSTNTPSTSTPSTGTSSESTPAAAEKEFKPVLSDTSLDDETKRVLDGITVTDANGAFEDSVVMNVKPGQTANGFSFDITFTKDGNEVQPNGSVTVKVPVPEALKGKTVYVFHVENDKYVLVSSEVKDGFVVFSADHFSEYVLSAENLNANSDTSNSTTAPDNGNPSTGIAVAAVPVLFAASAAAVIISKKKK